MNTVFVVRAVPVRRTDRTVIGWVRVDVIADVTKPTDMVYLRDGTAYGQEEAMRHITRNPELLYSTEAEAVREGIARLRSADADSRARDR
jgi:hypothetical protein